MDTTQILARYRYPRRRKFLIGPRWTPNKIIVHDPGQPDEDHNGIPDDRSAVGIANYCALPREQRKTASNPKGSTGGYHAEQDDTITVVSAYDEEEVDGAGGAEAHRAGLHICFCDYSDEALSRGAAIAAAWCNKWGIPKTRKAKVDWPAPGIYGHVDVPENTHTDPRGFPWERFLELLNPAPQWEDDDMPKPTDVVDNLTLADGQSWDLTANGGVITKTLDKKKRTFHGSYLSLPEPERQGERWFSSITIRDDGKVGYMLIANDGARYRFPS